MPVNTAIKIEEFWFASGTEQRTQIVLVLDTSASARQEWNNIHALALNLIRTLPGGTPLSVFFLGNPKAYPGTNFERESVRWYQENFRRARLIGPIFEQLEAKAVISVVVLATGKIFDVGDWVGMPILDCTTFVRFGSATLTEGRCCEWELGALVEEELKQRLNSTVTRMEISCCDAMPFFWNNNAYKLDGTKLVANQATQFAVCVGFLAPEGTPSTASSIRHCNEVPTLAHGGKRTMTLNPCDPPHITQDWKKLSEEEADIFSKCVRGETYSCPICESEHQANQLHCGTTGTRLIERPIYPTLENLLGFVLLKNCSGEVKYSLHPCAALRISDAAVAVLTSGKTADVYRFCSTSRTWNRCNERLNPYHLIGKDTYAIVL